MLRGCISILIAALSAGSAFAVDYRAGVAVVDVTPDFAVRLSGYGSRTEETAEVQQRLFAKALALGTPGQRPAVLITLDNCAIDLAISSEVCARIRKATGVPRERIAINVSHTHCAPMLSGVLPNLFSKPIPPEHQAHIDQYTAIVKEAMVKAAVDAISALQPVRLSFGIGQADFAANRRTPGGPTDHELPVLCAWKADGSILALVAGYACHCTTLQANAISGDWSGYAQEALQKGYPGSTAFVLTGCGADQNPAPRGTVEDAQRHGEALANAASQAVAYSLCEIDGPIRCKLKTTKLSFDTLPTREEFEARAKEDTPRGYHARVQLAKLERGEKLATWLPYTVQTWTFGDQLAMVFLAGEVVVDYSLRFKKEYDSSRLWVCGYSNDVPCYIPSRRVWEEGGYEGADAMVYYDRPTRFAPDVEDRIAKVVHDLLPRNFAAR